MATVDGDLRHDRPSTEHSSDHNEKDLGTLSTPAALEILSDPDADKSPAEKAEIVTHHILTFRTYTNATYYRIVSLYLSSI